ncbi:MAG: HEAT repeat domain-containing protein [Bacteroidia bacterium]|nr:HEAT repeat domain-containing protein [Bacteroidia bacterium]
MNFLSLRFFRCFLPVWIVLASCEKPVPKLPAITLDSHTADSLARVIREGVSAEVAHGLNLSLWASDSLVPDPIALSIDGKGVAYISSTGRRRSSEIDIRGHRNWMISSISFKTVEDRKNFIHTTLSPENSKDNPWLEDKNGDGSSDWNDLTLDKERVFRIEDRDADGIADRASVVIEDFHTEISDVAGAMLVYDGYIFVGVGPELWRLKDFNGDGIIEEKKLLLSGFGVHIGFGGHNMSGLTVGPDGKIWWGIGDIGSYVVDQNGKTWNYADQGAIFRCNTDGSDYEVFAAGLRNTHEFAFDDYGNLITVDNDGDHPGESERLVYLVDGSDSGWRTHWQFGKYSDPDNNAYKVWMDEKMYLPRWEGQTAHILPPIRNYHNGPAGMKFNPGTALSEKYKNHFFFAEFTGSPARSNVWAFELKPQGAGFEFAREEKVLGSLLATGMDFGPDGALYIADWIDGWATKKYGRIWKLDVPGQADTPIRKEVKTLLAEDFSLRTEPDLAGLLSHADKRVRQKAQFALARRGETGATTLKAATSALNPRIARIHAIWGIAQLAHQNPDHAESLVPLLGDADPEIRAQAARWLGEVRYLHAAEKLIPLLEDTAARVRFFATEALGRMAYVQAIHPIVQMLEKNNDQDVYLRHAGAIALARIDRRGPLAALAHHPSKAVRIAAVVALRRMRSHDVRDFLTDKDEEIVTEAARAINDDGGIEDALPALADYLRDPVFVNEALIRRAINANLRIGTEENLHTLADFSEKNTFDETLRAEAIAVIGTWAKPSVVDRLDGKYRGEITRNAEPAQIVLAEILPSLLRNRSSLVKIAAIDAAARLNLKDTADEIFALLQNDRTAEVRAAALEGLFRLGFSDMETAVQLALKDREKTVRIAGLGLTGQLSVTDNKKVELLRLVIEKSTTSEQQTALEALGKLPPAATEALFISLLENLEAGKLAGEIHLDLLEAIEKNASATLKSRTEAWENAQKEKGIVASFSESLKGGDSERGRRIFSQHEGAMCTRCHSVGEGGATVGPHLASVGNRLTREQLLESLLAPDTQLAAGYGIVILSMKDGSTRNGILLEETVSTLTIKTADPAPLKIAKTEILKRENAPSSMPQMGNILTRREIRDLVEYLTTLRGSDT